jgi:hypothetical protein
MTEPVDEPIKRSTVLQVGEHDGRVVVAISLVVSKGPHSKTKAISGAAYGDDAAAWRAVRDFATSRLLERAEEQVERPAKAEPQAPTTHPDAPF